MCFVCRFCGCLLLLFDCVVVCADALVCLCMCVTDLLYIYTALDLFLIGVLLCCVVVCVCFVCVFALLLHGLCCVVC